MLYDYGFYRMMLRAQMRADFQAFLHSAGRRLAFRGWSVHAEPDPVRPWKPPNRTD